MGNGTSPPFRVPEYSAVESKSGHIDMEPPKSFTLLISVSSNDLTSVAYWTLKDGLVFAWRKHCNRPRSKSSTQKKKKV